MPNNSLKRLMLVQDGRCFFCDAKIPKGEASVDHLNASARGGGNDDNNLVACCKAVNNLFDSMPLKDKFKVVLNQKGHFQCPNGNGHSVPKSRPTPATKHSPAQGVSQQAITAVINNLKSRGEKRPARLKTLASTIKSLSNLKLNETQVEAVIQYLQSSGKISVNNKQIAYNL